MNEAEKKVVMEVSAKLLEMASRLQHSDYFISQHDLGRQIAKEAGILSDILVNDSPAPATPPPTPAEPRKIYRYCDMKSMPRGIEMKEFVHADGSVTFVGQYYRHGAPEGAKPKRVYRIEVRKLPPFDDSFSASVFEDDVRLVHLRNGKSKWALVYAALGALRGILHKRCIATGTNRRAMRKAKSSK